MKVAETEHRSRPRDLRVRSKVESSLGPLRGEREQEPFYGEKSDPPRRSARGWRRRMGLALLGTEGFRRKMKGSNEFADFSGAGGAGDLERPAPAPRAGRCAWPAGRKEGAQCPPSPFPHPLPQSRVMGRPGLPRASRLRV